MANNADSMDRTIETDIWQLNALTEALGDLTVTINDSLSIGRGSDNDVVLGSKQVSRNHALLSILEGQLYVKDLDSSNGTFINNERIEGNKSSLLQVNDTIGFASFSFQVTVADTDTDTDTDTAIETLNPVVTDDSTAITNADSEERKVSEPTIEQPIVEEPAFEEPTINEPIIEAPVAKESVVKKTDIEEMLPAKDNTTPVPSDTTAATRTETAPTAAVNNEPLVEPPAVREEPVVQPEHDKTTKTELQEEADPEVLKAKQAATAQFSGTANLGQSHDLGTAGNNAMDQAVDNPANAGHVEKKPSGGWFIWVFLAIAIIGLALWLFNMGGTGAGA